MRILINADGTINAIGFQENYPLPCPPFININDAMRIKCINIPNYMDEASWVIIPEEVQE